jgi:hypothetical protein
MIPLDHGETYPRGLGPIPHAGILKRGVVLDHTDADNGRSFIVALVARRRSHELERHDARLKYR